jgi:hypothetical protein
MKMKLAPFILTLANIHSFAITLLPTSDAFPKATAVTETNPYSSCQYQNSAYGPIFSPTGSVFDRGYNGFDVTTSSFGDAKSFTLKHLLVTSKEDTAKSGDIFVEATVGGEVWMLGPGGDWKKQSDTGLRAYFSGKLSLVTPIGVFTQPVDLSAFIGTQLKIGYGLRENQASALASSYLDMTSNRRISLVYTVNYLEGIPANKYLDIVRGPLICMAPASIMIAPSTAQSAGRNLP